MQKENTVTENAKEIKDVLPKVGLTPKQHALNSLMNTSLVRMKQRKLYVLGCIIIGKEF